MELNSELTWFPRCLCFGYYATNSGSQVPSTAAEWRNVVPAQSRSTERLFAPQSHIGDVVGKSVVTIEGLNDKAAHPVLQAWIEHQVPQCGYCQTGQIMQAISLLELIPKPTDEEINEVMSGNLCRCGTYPRIRAAIHAAAAKNIAGK